MYTFHHDAGHGWLEVDRSELVRLGIDDQITPYSYSRGERVFLEEDLDQVTFLRAKERLGETVETNDRFYSGDAPCRSYRSYSVFREQGGG